MRLKKTHCTFLLGALASVAWAQTQQFSLVDNVRLNWTEAQTYCRRFFTDLATIEDRADTSSILNSTVFTGRFSELDSDCNSACKLDAFVKFKQP